MQSQLVFVIDFLYKNHHLVLEIQIQKIFKRHYTFHFPHNMSSTSPDYISNHIEDMDQIFPNYPQDLVQFALFDQEFFDTTQYFPQGDQEGSPKISLFVDEAPTMVQESTDKGDSCSAVTKGRRDRSKTIVTERKRRVRMKERLYELRSLVPNITKVMLILSHVIFGIHRSF